jgi:hypothetical protein
LNELGYRLEAGKFEPSYASEHALGNGKYLYVKRSRDGVVNKSPLVLAPETLALKAEIDRIAGIHCLWEKVKAPATAVIRKITVRPNMVLRLMLSQLKRCRRWWLCWVVNHL